MKQFKDPDFLSEFIDRYRNMRSLWEVKNPLYRNKPARKASMEKLVEFVKTRVPNADLEFVDKKIGSLESTHRKKLQKVQKSLRSGAAAEDVYVPSLWYYSRMHFLEDQIEARESLSSLLAPLPTTLPSTPAEASEDQPRPSILEEIDEPRWSQKDLSQDEAQKCGTQKEAGGSVSQEVGVSVSQEVEGPSLTQSQVPPLRLPTKRPRKGRNVEVAALVLIKEANDALKAPLDAGEAYGYYIASNMQKMEECQRLSYEKNFFEAIHKGLRGQMTDVHLCTLAHPLPPPATSPPPEPQAAGKAAEQHGGKAAAKIRK
ncbi:hypothetical protein AB205_0090260, partial [Aquarana catesbeiana]